MDYKELPIFDHDLVIIKVTFGFRSFAATKAAHFINLFME